MEKNKIEELIYNYNFIFSKNDYSWYYCSALGIGDILFSMTLLKNNLIEKPIIINLSFFSNNYTYPNPENALIFRLELIKNLFECNDLNKEDIIFSFSSTVKLNEHLDLIKNNMDITQFNLKIQDLKPNIGYELINNNLNNNEYIIFNTKCRFLNRYNYTNLKNKLKIFFSNFKSNFKIVLLGEQKMVDTLEAREHGISTIYNELLLLKENNEVIDLTKETIYNSLNFNEYLRDIYLLKKSHQNICIGVGGQLTTCLHFSIENIICFCDCTKLIDMIFNSSLLNTVIFSDFELFKSKIN